MTPARVVLLHARPARVDRNAPPVPLWLDDDACVRRALDVKRTHPPSPHFWLRLAELAQVGAAIVDGRVGAAGWVERTAHLLAELTAELPEPSAAEDDPRVRGSRWLTGRHRPVAIDDLSDCITRIAVALTDPNPPCRDGLYGLADLIDDFAVAAATYLLTEAPAPNPYHPSVSTRGGDRGPP